MTATQTPNSGAFDSLDRTEPYVLGRDEGTHLHFLNNLATLKAGRDTTMSAVEFVAPKGFGPPLHMHQDEDEIVVVYDGEIAFRSGDTETIASDGAFVWLPHGVPHTFQVLSDSARMLSITASVAGDPVFDQFVSALGEPTDEAAMPGPMDIDPGQVAQAAALHRIDILGPPPAPLEQ